MIEQTVINPDKNNKLIFRMILLVGVAVIGFATWLMVTATVRLK
jgi:hypothetical protein